jgi:hypothetical protein
MTSPSEGWAVSAHRNTSSHALFNHGASDCEDRLVTLNTRFLPTFMAILDDFAERGYFAHEAGDDCDGHPVSWLPQRVERALTIAVGYLPWPFEGDPTSSTDMIPYVEGFFQICHKPVGGDYHPFCQGMHWNEFDVATGHYDFTVSMNKAFANLGTGLRLQSGKVIATGSVVLSQMVEPLPFGGDAHLELLVTQALHGYRTSDRQRRYEAIRSLADAFERVKTIVVPGNKRSSVEQLIDQITPAGAMHDQLDGLFRAITATSNGKAIRHHEVGAEPVWNDDELIDFLFYAYYNVIRLSLRSLYPAG